jgi:hypothetical protein
MARDSGGIGGHKPILLSPIWQVRADRRKTPLVAFLSSDYHAVDCKRDSIEMFFHLQLQRERRVRTGQSACVSCQGELEFFRSESNVMSSGGPRLGHLEPRERAGAQTGRKYEYQYERTARAALDLLAIATGMMTMWLRPGNHRRATYFIR